MSFRTKLDYSDNRQIKQHPSTLTHLSGGTIFGLPINQIPTGPDLSTSAITDTILDAGSLFLTSGGVTTYAWYDDIMQIGYPYLSAITLSNSGVTQYVPTLFTAGTTTVIDGNNVVLSYTGISYDLTPIAMFDLGSNNYSGTVVSEKVNFFSASTLESSGRTIWVDVCGMTRTEKLIVTNSPQSGYVLTCTNSEGLAEWKPSANANIPIVISYWTAGTGTNSVITIGGSNIAGGNYALAEGQSTQANGIAAHAEGSGSIASGDWSHAEGYQTQALSYAAHAEGDGSIAHDRLSHAEGDHTQAYGGSHSEGSYTQALGTNCHTEGNGTIASFTSSHAEGSGSIASGQTSHAEGNSTIASGDYSHSEGDGTIASGLTSHAEGYLTKAQGQYSHSEGRETKASGDSSHAEGYLTLANDFTSHAEGSNSTAIGPASHAEGTDTQAIGISSHAEGDSTIAFGELSHTEGKSTRANGEASHAEGYQTTAGGLASHAEGQQTIASGITSHAGGKYTTAGGDYSFVHGQNSIANGNATIVLGSNLVGLSAHTTYVENLNIKTNGIFTLGSTVVNENKLAVINATLSTGLYIFSNGGITTTGATTFNVGAVRGVIVDSNDILNTNPTFVNYPGESGKTTPYRLGYPASYLMIDKNSTLVILNSRPTATQRRDNIFLGAVGHAGNSIDSYGNQPDILMNEMSQLRAMFEPLRLINEGVIMYPSSINIMSVGNTLGNLYGLGIGFIKNGNSAPTVIPVPGNPQTTFQYRTRDSGNFLDTTEIDPLQWDNNGNLETIAGNANSTNATNQRIYLLEDASIRVQYGQAVYATLTDAISGANGEPFVVFPNNKNLGILIGILSIRKNTINLSNTDYAKFLPVSKFGESVGSAAGVSTTTLQSAYNNSAQSEISTNIANGPLSIRRGSTTDTDIVFEIRNGGDSPRFTVNGFGDAVVDRLKIGSVQTGTLVNNLGVDVNGNVIVGSTGGSGATTTYWSAGTGTNAIVTKNGNNKASGAYSLAEGSGTTAIAAFSHAEGYGTVASGTSSAATLDVLIIGGDTVAAHAEGFQTTSMGLATHAEGYLTIASGMYTHAEGQQTQATGATAHAEGYATRAYGQNSHSEGSFSTSLGTNSHAEGDTTLASGYTSHAEGYQSIAQGDYSHAEGYATSSIGESSHAEGRMTKAAGESSHAEGGLTQATGFNAHAEGNSTSAGGSESHAEGQSTQAIGSYSHAEGYNTTAGADGSHTEGNRTTAYGPYSHAEGSLTYVYSTAAGGHAEGISTVASGNSAHAEGRQTYANGDYSHSQGYQTIAGGLYSHAGGYLTSAGGVGSFVHGTGSTANANNVMILGSGITGNTANTTYVDNLNIKTVGGSATIDIGINGTGLVTVQASDERLKENITTLENSLNKVKQLRGIKYQWKDRLAGGDEFRIGFIAQEVNKVEPLLTFTNNMTEEQFMGVHYKDVTALLIEAIKELSSEVNSIIQDSELIIPRYTPSSFNDTNGIIGSLTRDEDYLYMKTNTGWKRTKFENF